MAYTTIGRERKRWTKCCALAAGLPAIHFRRVPTGQPTF